jgi:5-methylcytosine-specific restriction endonuclease McrA
MKPRIKKPGYKIKDITGQPFGRWTVQRFVRVEKCTTKTGRSHMKYFWECLCGCGTTKEVEASHLRSGRSQSCGCISQQKPIVGERRGMLVISGGMLDGKHWKWIADCDCGGQRLVLPWTFMAGNNTNCGCQRNLNLSGYKDTFARYKGQAKRRHIPFELTFEEFMALMKGDCHYCGRAPSQVCYRHQMTNPVRALYSGVDRLDSQLPYRPDNVVSCCKNCNWAKKEMPYDEFIQWIVGLANNHLKNPERLLKTTSLGNSPYAHLEEATRH